MKKGDITLPKKPLVFTVANRKGGVSKTTNTVNIGNSLAQMGYKVLLIDDDPQGSLTQLLGIDRTIGNSPELSIDNLGAMSRELRDAETNEYPLDDLFGPAPDEELLKTSYTGLHDLIMSAYYNQPISYDDIKKSIVSPTFTVERAKKRKVVLADGTEKLVPVKQKFKFGFDLLPSSEELTDDELIIGLDNDPARSRTKGLFMDVVVKAISRYMDYDFILIDTGPSLGILTLNALAAGRDGIIISAAVDEQSLWSLQKFKYNLRTILGLVGTHKGILGVLIAPCAEKSQLFPIIAHKIKHVLKLYMFETKIPKSVNAAKATASGLLFTQLDERANKAYLELSEEIIYRAIENHEWYEDRQNKIAEEIARMKKEEPAYEQDSNEKLINIIKVKYAQNELWSMPVSKVGRKEEE